MVVVAVVVDVEAAVEVLVVETVEVVVDIVVGVLEVVVLLLPFKSVKNIRTASISTISAAIPIVIFCMTNILV